jgi:alpha-L-fucosidase
MFDTKLTDYKITNTGCPFHTNPKANITKEIFDAFRAEGMWVGPYFSKPDWHCNNYWNPYFPPLDRNVNYDPAEYPDKWEKYVQFTQNQILELMTDYGKIDILWLDGGWVAKQSKDEIKNFYDQNIKESESGFLKGKIVNQDIRMDELVEKARQKQPGLIVVDRAVPGKNQNYLTPENTVPKEALPYPWESCIIAGGSWSWIPDATYMTGREAIHLLVDIVAKGGNLLLNIAPGPHGRWHDEAYQLLTEMGDWMRVNSEAIYETRAIQPYKEGNCCFTQKKDGTIFLIYLAGQEETNMPASFQITSLQPKNSANVMLIGAGNPLKWKNEGNKLIIQIPDNIRKNPPCNYAWALKLTGFEVNIK